MSICNTSSGSKKQNLRVKNNLVDINVNYSMYSVGTLRSHYSRYLKIFLAHNTITNTKCNGKITVLLTQPCPTHGWTHPMSISVLLAAKVTLNRRKLIFTRLAVKYQHSV